MLTLTEVSLVRIPNTTAVLRPVSPRFGNHQTPEGGNEDLELRRLEQELSYQLEKFDENIEYNLAGSSPTPNKNKLKHPILFNLYDLTSLAATSVLPPSLKSDFFIGEGYTLLKAGQLDRAERIFKRSLDIALPKAKRGGEKNFMNYFNVIRALQGLVKVYDHQQKFTQRTEATRLLAEYERKWEAEERL